MNNYDYVISQLGQINGLLVRQTVLMVLGLLVPGIVVTVIAYLQMTRGMYVGSTLAASEEDSKLDQAA